MAGNNPTQLMFDFGSDDRAESANLPEVVDIGDAEDSLGLPPSGTPEEGESLSFSSPEEEEALPGEDALSDDMEAEGVEILTGEEDFSEHSGKEKEGQKDDSSSQTPQIVFTEAKKLPFDAKNIKRAALAFLGSLSPDAIAADVPTRYRKYAVDAAAFWSRIGKKGRAEVFRTAVADVLTEEAVSVIAGRETLLQALAEAKNSLASLEEKLRREDPSLRVQDSLFAEEERWDYSRTKDPAYRALIKKIRGLEETLFHGTRFEKLKESSAASLYYAVVPENLIDPACVAPEWGLVYILPDLSFRLVKEAQELPCSPESMNSLALNIGRMAFQNVLFANGVAREGKVLKVVRLPRKRRE